MRMRIMRKKAQRFSLQACKNLIICQQDKIKMICQLNVTYTKTDKIFVVSTAGQNRPTRRKGKNIFITMQCASYRFFRIDKIRL
jgi:hypothetical protein